MCRTTGEATANRSAGRRSACPSLPGSGWRCCLSACRGSFTGGNDAGPPPPPPLRLPTTTDGMSRPLTTLRSRPVNGFHCWLGVFRTPGFVEVQLSKNATGFQQVNSTLAASANSSHEHLHVRLLKIVEAHSSRKRMQQSKHWYSRV